MFRLHSLSDNPKMPALSNVLRYKSRFAWIVKLSTSARATSTQDIISWSNVLYFGSKARLHNFVQAFENRNHHKKKKIMKKL